MKIGSFNLLHHVGQECEYRFTRQPPTALSCNPYDLVNRLALVCSVEGPSTTTFSINWFRRRNNKDKQLHARFTAKSKHWCIYYSRPKYYCTVYKEFFTPNTQWTRWRGWCWSVLVPSETGDGTLFHEKSNILTLSAEEQYQDPRACPCEGSNTANQMDCL